MSEAHEQNAQGPFEMAADVAFRLRNKCLI